MGRPAGVTATAIIQIIGSALALMTGSLVIMGMLMARQDVRGLGVFIAGMGAVILGLSALGIWTGIALLKLRPWARISTLVFAGFMSLVCTLAAAAMGLVPVPSGPDAQQQLAFTAMRPVLVGIYMVPVVVGVVWLVYFNRAATKAAFAAPYEPGGPELRPLSISIIGWLSVVGGVFIVPMALIGLPAFLAGVVLTGWSARFAYLILGGIGLYLGWAVLKLKEIGRRLMIGWYGLTIVHAAYVALVPAVRSKMADVQRAMPFPTAPGAGVDISLQDTMSMVMMLVGVALAAVAIWFLVKERARFS